MAAAGGAGVEALHVAAQHHNSAAPPVPLAVHAPAAQAGTARSAWVLGDADVLRNDRRAEPRAASTPVAGELGGKAHAADTVAVQLPGAPGGCGGARNVGAGARVPTHALRGGGRSSGDGGVRNSMRSGANARKSPKEILRSSGQQILRSFGNPGAPPPRKDMLHEVLIYLSIYLSVYPYL